MGREINIKPSEFIPENSPRGRVSYALLYGARLADYAPQKSRRTMLKLVLRSIHSLFKTLEEIRAKQGRFGQGKKR